MFTPTQSGLVALLSAFVLANGARTLASIPPQRATQRIVSFDLVRAKPGERDRLLRFFQVNWEAARRTALEQHIITDYRLLVRTDTGGSWDIALETEYADSSAYARREELFAPILRAKGKILVDGLDRPSLGDIVETRQLRLANAR